MFKESENRYKTAISRTLSAEVACDYVLPDYLGEVRKILFTEACALPLPTYVNGEEICASGAVRFRMIYTDSEGEMSSVEFTEDYEVCDRAEDREALALNAESYIASYSMRLVGPRKISAKARVAADLTLISEAQNELVGTAMELGGVELASESISVIDSVIGETSELEYAEELAALEGAIADEVRVVYETAESHIGECRAANDEVWVSGEHCVTALVCVSGAPACIYRKSIPFAETLGLKGATDAMTACVRIEHPSVKVNVTPTESGTSLVASLISAYTPMAEGNTEIKLYTDGYLTDREVECEHRELETDELLHREILRDAFEVTLSPEVLSLESPREILFVRAEARPSRTELVDGTLHTEAEIRFSGIACEINAEGAPVYAPLRYTAEYKHSIPVEIHTDGDVITEVDARTLSASGRVEECGVILSATVELDARISEKHHHRALCRIDAVGEPYAKRSESCIRVYYPDSEDTLFSVARRFRTTTERIAIDNALTDTAVADKSAPASLRGVAKLIIK